MGVGQAELGLLVQMALEAGFRRFAGIDDEAFATTGFHVLAAGTVAAFATHIHGVLALGLELGVICGAEVANKFFMAGGAFLGAHEGGTGDAWRGQHRAVGGARNKHNCKCGTGTGTPKQIAWLVEDPSADG